MYLTSIIQQTRVAILGQSRHQAILRKHIEALGGQIELGTEFTDLQQDEDVVTVTLTKTSGDIKTDEVAKFAYVIGTDGGRSMCSLTVVPACITNQRDCKVPLESLLVG